MFIRRRKGYRGRRKGSGRRGINSMKTRASRRFTRCAVRCAAKLSTYHYQILGEGTANDTLTNVYMGKPIFINLTEVIAYGVQQMATQSSTGTVLTLPQDIIKAFVESLTVKLNFNNNVGSSSQFNGNTFKVRLMEFYYRNNVSYLTNDHNGNPRPQWATTDPTTGAGYSPASTLLWKDRQFNFIADEGDWNYITDAQVNFTTIPYHKSRFHTVRPSPSTSAALVPGSRQWMSTFRYKPKRPMSFITQTREDVLPASADQIITFDPLINNHLTRYLMIVADDYSYAPGSTPDVCQVRGQITFNGRNLM